MATTFDMPIDKLAETIASGISVNLESLILSKLKPRSDAILSELARELARDVVVQMAGYRNHGIGPEIVLHLNFNKKEVAYVNSTGEITDVK